VTTVLVSGATGALGSQIARRLVERGAVVRALVRSEAHRSATAGVELVRADLEAPETLAGAVAGADVVVSTATSFPRDSRPDAIERVDRNGTIALAEAAEAAGVRRFVFVSFRPVLHRFPLQDAKRTVEQGLLNCSFEPVVLQPGKFMDIWFSPLCGFDAREARVQLFGRGESPVSWIAAADVAEVACRAALASEPQPEVLELGGPEPLSQREVVRVFERATGRPFVVDEIPREELEQRHRDGGDPTSVSLAALMLEADDGAVADLEPIRAVHPIPLTTVAEFAATRPAG
jgi:uncharacterized protein YbjT (DUF2867 family)